MSILHPHLVIKRNNLLLKCTLVSLLIFQEIILGFLQLRISELEILHSQVVFEGLHLGIYYEDLAFH